MNGGAAALMVALASACLPEVAFVEALTVAGAVATRSDRRPVVTS